MLVHKARKRLIQFCEVEVLCRAHKVKGLAPDKLLTLLTTIKNSQNALEILRDNKKNTATTYLADIEIHPAAGYAVLLLNCSDRTAADPTFTVPKHNTRREIKKNLGEGQDFSAHILLKLNPHKKNASVYEALVEYAPNLPIPRVQQYLSYLFRRCTAWTPQEFVRAHPDGSKDASGKDKTVSVYHGAKIRAEPSKQLINDINSGTIQSIQLITAENPGKKLDFGQHSEVMTSELHITPRVANFNGTWIQYINSVCLTANKNAYETARVTFKTKLENLKTAYFETDGAIPIEDRYIRRETISFDHDLPSSLQEISPIVVGKMRKLK